MLSVDREEQVTLGPLGPGSLTWDCIGDLRCALLIIRAGVLQAMHPAVGAALVEHSDVFENQWNRLLRSVPPILATVYAGEKAPAIGRRVRDFHTGISGVDETGRSYHALTPDVFFWTHATFFESQIAMRELYARPLRRDEKERLYDESIRWYATYGVSLRPVPPDYAAFERYWDGMIAEVLVETEPVRWTFSPAARDSPPPFPWLAGLPWRVLRPVVVDGSNWLARGTLPVPIRERLGLEWNARDERQLRAFRVAVRGTFGALPTEWRYGTAVRKARRRGRTETAA